MHIAHHAYSHTLTTLANFAELHGAWFAPKSQASPHRTGWWSGLRFLVANPAPWLQLVLCDVRQPQRSPSRRPVYGVRGARGAIAPHASDSDTLGGTYVLMKGEPELVVEVLGHQRRLQHDVGTFRSNGMLQRAVHQC